MAAHVNAGRRLVALVLAVCLSCGVAARVGGPEGRQRLQIGRHLKRLNKPPVKSIKSPDGDIIDCVHVAHQPAFDHPLLKNHTIQTRPNFHPENLFDDDKVASQKKTPSGVQLWHQNGRCPEDTVPIRRTSRADVLRASSIKRYGRKKHKSIPNPLSVEPDLLNENGHQRETNTTEQRQRSTFGSQVSPDLYGDNNTRLFSYWTSDAYQATGCYNLLCSGFIQVNNEIAMGASIYPISNYDGSQYDISILVWKDPKEGNWWLQFGRDYVLGYWPSFLFSYLADSASMIEWGGEVVNSEPDGEHTSTEMGSGHFPEEGYSKASYFRNIQIVDGSNNLRAPTGVGAFTEQSNCYDVQNGNNGEWGQHFYYGGPGRNSNCP
ncbi:hypothetical protein ZIOFF_001361 [Zingiber officinale]|uniref:Neprosin PEP catalytic domain-containing protein n=1 Tax=Zingiber officinale TaxID=94328 RepID=A0A8J5I5S9_ZINOF|nr:hypothetical protein ZIOFF_001361 [Zingiber officinale]